METDASAIGIGGVLRQDGKPIVYLSRTLNDAERNYSITEREVLAALWAMEKVEYYLIGHRFEVITDHKAMEVMQNKLDFGTGRIARWMERFSRFDFGVTYRKGEDMVLPDALSRAPAPIVKRVREIAPMEQRVLQMHKELNHRKGIERTAQACGVDVNETIVKEAIAHCENCQRKDKIYGKTCTFIQTEAVGERLGIDILDSGECLVILAIDYFSRKAFGQTLEKKTAQHVVKFLERVYQEFPFKTMLTDNGREFLNRETQRWCDERGVAHKNSIPYYHNSNGRVERLCRTVREALYKTPGPVRVKLGGVLKNYNALFHRGIGMAPDEAVKEDNYNRVIKAQEIYRKEFKARQGGIQVFNIGETVWIRKEVREARNDDRFSEKGVITGIIGKDIYQVETGRKGELRRHASQLKRVIAENLEGGR